MISAASVNKRNDFMGTSRAKGGIYPYNQNRTLW